MGIKPWREQIKASKEMLKGKLIEMRTGEGKSMVSYLTAKELIKKHKSVYIVSVNNYLAKRDYDIYRDMYDSSVEVNFCTKDNMINSGVIYCSSEDLIFSYLQASLEFKNFDLEAVIIDEVDFVLIDNANSEFAISKENVLEQDSNEIINLFMKVQDFYKTLSKVAGHLNNKVKINEDLVVENDKCFLTDNGIYKYEKYFNERYDRVTDKVIALNDIALAYNCYYRGYNYEILNNRIVLLSESNGRLRENSRLENGLQLALQLKEKCKLEFEVQHTIGMSYQIFYNKFKFMCGMSGTLKESRNEFLDIYGKEVKKIKAHHKLNRIDNDDIFVNDFSSQVEFIADKINTIENPVLIIGKDNRICEKVYNYLKEKIIGKSINLLTSLNYEDKEVEVIEEAGKRNVVTIATFLASRGTDIKLEDNNLGLFVYSLNHFENKRIDNQIRGRSGRMGLTGFSQFVVDINDTFFNKEDFKVINKQRKSNVIDFKKMNKIVKHCQSLSESIGRSSRKNLFLVNLLLERDKKYLLHKFTKVGNLYEIEEDILNEISYCYNFSNRFMFLKDIRLKLKDLNDTQIQELFYKISCKSIELYFSDFKKDIYELALNYDLTGFQLIGGYFNFLIEHNKVLKNFIKDFNKIFVDFLARMEKGDS